MNTLLIALFFNLFVSDIYLYPINLQTSVQRTYSSPPLGFKSDTAKIGSLLRSARAQVCLKTNRDRTNDLAISLLQQATLLNEQLKSKRMAGEIALTASGIYRTRGNSVIGKRYVDRAALIFRKLEDDNKLGECLEEISKYDTTTNQQIKITNIKRALAAFNRARNRLREAHCYIVLGRADADNQRLNQAAKEYNTALQIYRSVGYTKLQEVYMPMADLYDLQGDWKNSYTFASRSLEAYRASHDTSSTYLFAIYNLLGFNADSQKKTQNAIDCYYQARSVAIKSGNIESIYTVSCNLAPLLSQNGRNTEALALLKSTQKIYPESSEAFSRIRFTAALLTAYTKSKNAKWGRVYADKLIGLASFLKVEDRAFIYYQLMQYYLMSGQMDQVKKYKLLTDSAVRLRLSEKTSSAEPLKNRTINARIPHKAATEKKQDSYPRMIINANTQENFKKEAIESNQKEVLTLINLNKLQQRNLRLVTYTRDLIIGASCLLVLLLFITFYGLQRIRRNNRQLKAQQLIIGQKNRLLEKLLSEKEWLVKETHHRVKNNLQIIISLLNTHISYLRHNDIALNAIRESQQRMQSVALIHQKLYRSENMETISMSEYIEELVERLAESFDRSEGLKFDLKLTPVELDVSQAVPVGLILNEAVTNAIKHGLKGNSVRMVGISLSKSENAQLSVSVIDNGPGFPPDLNIEELDSLGINLMRGLSGQLGGKLAVGRHNQQTMVTIVFQQRPLTLNLRTIE